MTSSGVVYETLDPIFLSESTDLSERYAVFRREIGSSTCGATPSPAVDFFSLDASTEEVDPHQEEPLKCSPSCQTTPRIPEAENRKPEVAWFRATSRFRSPMVQLHQEILDFCDFISPTSEEHTSRDAAVQRVSEVIKYIWPHSTVEVFGSFRTGLYLPTSDIDVVILNSNVRTPQMGLSALAKAISQRNVGKKIQVIAKARVPIIKFVEKQSGIAFDLSFDMESGPNAADFIKDAVVKMPPLRPLCLVLKVFLQQRELNEVFLGGIGSYALISMLIAHLQIHQRKQNSPSKKVQEHNLGLLLVDFFDVFGRKLNNWHVGVSCSIAGSFFIKSSRGFFNVDRPYLLSIEDPQDPNNDIGRNSYNYFKVKSAFSGAFSSLTDTDTILHMGSLKSILGTIIRPDHILLQRRGGSKGDLTFDRLLPGAGEPGPPPLASGDFLCNWQLMDEEPFPRTPALVNGLTVPKKRKVVKSNCRVMENGNSKISNVGEEASGKREKIIRRQQQRGHSRDDESYSAGRSVPFCRSPWSQ